MGRRADLLASESHGASFQGNLRPFVERPHQSAVDSNFIGNAIIGFTTISAVDWDETHGGNFRQEIATLGIR